MNERRPEILAPAGSMESLIAAVRCGANAVYLGSKSLNARRNAGNFDDVQLEEAIVYCHERNVKVYQTLNILLFEEERAEAIKAIETAARLGVDALLTQDLAIAALAKACAPTLPLHASTQMSIHSLQGALQAQALGFERVVLARELSKNEIEKIVKGTTLDIEVFVHGALCMSVSGQCYLSSMIGERSGNRGLCAQPCRLPFGDGKEESFALSLKDLTLVDKVQVMKKIGVSSLKIEGRMKRPEYVAAAVTALKNALEGRSVDFEQLRSVFSRGGFTSAYFDGSMDKGMFGVRQKEDVTAAGGVLNDLARLFDRETPLVPVNIAFTAKAGEPITLAITDEQSHVAIAQGEAPQGAQNAPATPEKVTQNLEKMGGTPYFAQNVDCQVEDGLFLPASALNALRRDAIEALAAKRQTLAPHGFTRVDMPLPARIPATAPFLQARLRGEQLTEEILACCKRVILPLEDIPHILARNLLTPDRVAVEIPRLLFGGEEALLAPLKALVEQGVTFAYVGNIGGLGLAKQAGLTPLGSFALNITNTGAVAEYAALGLADTECSFELSLPKARKLGGGIPLGLVAYGHLPLMALRSCPIKARIGCGKCNGNETLTDRKGVRFPIVCRDKTFSELLNAVPLYLGDRQDELTGFGYFTLYFTNESRERCTQVTQSFVAQVSPDFLKSGHTRGLYYRNVQ